MLPDIWTFLEHHFYSGYELRIIFNFLLGMLAGTLIGRDREKKGKAAGVSTHSMVICSSMLFTFLSSLQTPDPTRIAAQIVTGIGFLGAGIILKQENNKIQNLTTAASIWFSAGIGMTIGFGLYGIALISVAFAFIIFRYLPHPVAKPTSGGK